MGKVVEVCGHDSYMIKMDGSGRTSKWRRSFLKPMKPSPVKLLKTLGKALTPPSPNEFKHNGRVKKGCRPFYQGTAIG